MDARELKKLIARGEGRTLEFKASFSNEAVETIAAKLPHGLTVPMLLRGDYPSTPRNTQIAEMFKEAGVIERYGSGIARIIKDFKEYGLAAPEFAEVGSSFIVTVYKKRISGLIQGRVPERVPEKVPEKVTVNQAKILSELTANSHITAKELAGMIGISIRKIKENLSKLKAKGFIKRVGPDKGGHWEVL